MILLRLISQYYFIVSQKPSTFDITLYRDTFIQFINTQILSMFSLT